MARLLKNFAYCALTAGVSNSAVSFLVDETSRLPSNASLSTSVFCMTVEGTYADGSFEIVQVTAKSATSGPGTLTVVRGQEDTIGVAHLSGAYVKASLTSGIIADLLAANSFSRATVAYTTAALAGGATETGVVVMAASYTLLAIATSAAARVRVYESAATRAADSTRAIGTDPASSGSGVVLDFVTTPANLSAALTPVPVGINMESPPSSSIPIAVTATAAGAITATFTFLRME